MLASQLIPKYLKHFPQKTASAIDALLDLCEEDLVDVKKKKIHFLKIKIKKNRLEYQLLEYYL